MPHVYITEPTRVMLETLVIAEKRGYSDELELLCEKRLKELGLPDVIKSSDDSNNVQNSVPASQG